MAWGDQRASIFVLGVVCVVLLNSLTTATAQAPDAKEEKKLQRLDQNAASPGRSHRSADRLTLRFLLSRLDSTHAHRRDA